MLTKTKIICLYVGLPVQDCQDQYGDFFDPDIFVGMLHPSVGLYDDMVNYDKAKDLLEVMKHPINGLHNTDSLRKIHNWAVEMDIPDWPNELKPALRRKQLQTEIKHKKIKQKSDDKKTKRIELLSEMFNELSYIAAINNIEFDKSCMSFSNADLHEMWKAYGKNMEGYSKAIWGYSLGSFRPNIWYAIKEEGKLELKDGVSAEKSPDNEGKLKKIFLDKHSFKQ